MCVEGDGALWRLALLSIVKARLGRKVLLRVVRVIKVGYLEWGRQLELVAEFLITTTEHRRIDLSGVNRDFSGSRTEGCLAVKKTAL